MTSLLDIEKRLVAALEPIAAKYEAITPDDDQIRLGFRHPDQMKDDEQAMLFVDIGDLRRVRTVLSDLHALIAQKGNTDA